MRERKTRGSEKKRFNYVKRDVDGYKKRGAQSGGRRDSFLDEKFTIFRPQKGDNYFRILPPSWEDADHFGLDTWVHWNIGSDKNAYLCLESDPNSTSKCPICQEKEDADRTGDSNYSKELKPSKRVLYWLINRDEEKEGPLLWAAPWTIDRDICLLAVDKRTGEQFDVDDPEQGYDISFNYTIPSGNTPGKYEAIQIARKPSELGDEDWLEFIQSNPLPSVLKYFEASYISDKFAGNRAEDNSDTYVSEDEDRDKEVTWTYDSVMEAKRKVLEDLADELKFTNDEVDGMDDEVLKDEICKELKLEASQEENESKSSDYKEKLRRLRREKGE